VLILLDSLQTQILKSTELLGQKESQLATQAGAHQLAAVIVMRRDVLVDQLLFPGRHATWTTAWCSLFLICLGLHLGELQQTLKELSENKAALTAQKLMCDQLSTSQSRLERRVELLTKERDSLKQILTLYQEEDTKPAVAGAASTLWLCKCCE